MKMCQQCHRTLDDDQFRQNTSRGAGLRKRKVGARNICRLCESKNAQAHYLMQKMDAGESVNEATLGALREHYGRLLDAGYEIVTGAARRLMNLPLQEGGLVVPNARQLQGDYDLYEHVGKLRRREYASVDEADKVHRQLSSRLRTAGLYEEATNLLDDWWME